MTTYFTTTVTCAHCGNESRRQALGSTNAFGSPDLDLRPPAMQRWTMDAWLQLCPSCGHVAPSLDAPVPDVAVLTSASYREVLADATFPELARLFLARALLLAGHDPAAAAQGCLHAAWVCDDAEQPELAALCRSRAVDHFERLKPFPDTRDGVTQGAVCVDVLRRAGRFAEAGRECATLLALTSTVDILRQVLDYQQRLIAAGDAATHTVEEAVRP